MLNKALYRLHKPDEKINENYVNMLYKIAYMTQYNTV